MKIQSVVLSVLMYLLITAGTVSAVEIRAVTISNENGLMDMRIAAGHGSDSLYDFLLYLQPYSDGAIPNAFMTNLNATRGSSDDAFEYPITLFADWSNNPIVVGEDGNALVAGVFGRYYYGTDGYTTVAKAIPGLGTVLFTYANDYAHYIDSGANTPSTGETRYYKTFLIVWNVSCAYTLSSASDSFGTSSGLGSVTLTASDSRCSWTAVSNNAWITVTAGEAGTGTGTVSYSVDANIDAGNRTGTITIAGETFTVTQSGTAPSCTYTLSSTAESVGSAAASGSVTVTASDGSCAWNAISDASWIDVTAGSSGTGTGTVSYSIAVNNMLAARTGTLTIAGHTFTITQSAAPACTYTLSPSAISFDASSAQNSVTVTPSAGACAWTAASNASWITVTAGSSGTGTGTVSYSVAANTAAGSRTGTLIIGGQTFTVIQSGTVPSLDTVQKAYIGYYQRPADPAGLIWWADYLATHGGSLVAIIEAFANSDESRALYGEINSGNIAAVIDAIYQALFNRQADTAGRDWYVAEFNKGSFTAATIMLNVLYGAQNDDLVTLNNKLVTANLFTKTIDPELDSSSFRATYAGDADAVAARAFLGLVSAAASSVPTQSQITEYIKSYIADPGDSLLGH